MQERRRKPAGCISILLRAVTTDVLARIVDETAQVGLQPGLFAFGPMEEISDMNDIVIKDNLLRPMLSKPQSRAELIDSVARAMIKAQADEREAKTLRLRRTRLEMEARRPVPAPTKSRSAKKARAPASRRVA